MLVDARPLDASRLSAEPISQRIAIARGWVDRLNSEARLVEASLESWRRYLDLLERVHCAEQDLEVAAVNGRVPISRQAAKACFLTELVVHFAFQQTSYRTNNKATVAWTVRQGLYRDRKRANVAVSSILAHRRDLFRRVDRGVYTLTAKATELGRRLSLDMRAQLPLSPADDAGLAPSRN